MIHPLEPIAQGPGAAWQAQTASLSKSWLDFGYKKMEATIPSSRPCSSFAPSLQTP